jgi:hypothetical protein
VYHNGAGHQPVERVGGGDALVAIEPGSPFLIVLDFGAAEGAVDVLDFLEQVRLLARQLSVATQLQRGVHGSNPISRVHAPRRALDRLTALVGNLEELES